MVSLQIVSSDNLDRTLEVLINGKRYLFWFHGEVPLPTVRKIMRHSAGRTIQYLKRVSYKVDKLVMHAIDQKESNIPDQETEAQDQEEDYRSEQDSHPAT